MLANTQKSDLPEKLSLTEPENSLGWHLTRAETTGLHVPCRLCVHDFAAILAGSGIQTSSEPRCCSAAEDAVRDAPVYRSSCIFGVDVLGFVCPANLFSARGEHVSVRKGDYPKHLCSDSEPCICLAREGGLRSK